uniref:Uncharacterized protein n=1 Tax=Arundo donax TaxID=35708 RepID=A0A0A8XQH5_ARUDO
MDSIILMKEVIKLLLQPRCLHVRNYYYFIAGLDTPLLLLFLAFICLFLMHVLGNPLYVMLVSLLNIQGFYILVWVQGATNLLMLFTLMFGDHVRCTMFLDIGGL